MTPADLAHEITTRGAAADRFIVGVAGPPGAGKSTIAQAIAAAIGARARVVPMDGFHLDNAVLDRLGLRARKGAPETFDALGFVHLMQRLRAGGDAAIPVFDRDADLARAGADLVTRADKYLIVEGNYLLLDEAPWRDLAPLFDLTVFIDVPEDELDRRLVQRWHHHGKTPQEARHWIDSNDMPNIRRVTQGSRQADIVIGD
jgi:pantothenate kinase